MSEPSTTHEETSWFGRPVRAITILVVRWPRTTLGLGLVLAIASMILMTARLELKTSRLDLLNPNSQYNQLWLQYLQEFGGEDDVVILVEGTDQEQVKSGMDELALELEREKNSFKAVFHKADLTGARSHALYYLPEDKLAELGQGLKRLQPILAGDWSALNVGNQLAYSAMGAQSPDDAQRKAAMETLSLHVQNLQAKFAGKDQYRSPWAEWDALGELQNSFSAHYAVVKEGQMGVILLRLIDDGTKFDRGTVAIKRLRTLLTEFQQSHDGVKVGLTGLPVMENDEMKSNESASLKTSVVSLLGVAGLFIAGFGGIRHPLLAVAALMIGLAWSCGFLTLAVGHLNILSMAFGVILIGLGIDFGIHYVARYLALRGEIHESEPALIKTAVAVGPGIVTGGLTTAVAFLATALTDFTGVAELGIIAGSGIVLCVLSAMLMLPAMIQWMDQSSPHRPLPKPIAVAPTVWFSENMPRATIFVSLGIVLFCAMGLPWVWYDHNLLHLQAEGLESVHLEQRLLAETDQSVWYAISIADSKEELLARKAKFEELATVERTEEIASFLPNDVDAKQSLVEAVGHELLQLPNEPPLLQLASLPQFLGMLGQMHAQLQATQQTVSAESIRLLGQRVASLPPAQAMEKISQYQQHLASDLLHRLQLLQGMSEPTPPTLETLPEGLRARFVGRSGKQILKVYSNADIWNMEELAKFVTDVRQVDPLVTGQPLQTFEGSQQMQRSYIHASLYALIGVAILLVIDFQSLGFALLSLTPVGLGLLQTFGLMGLLDIPLNPANMIVLPLILGIGLDDGVHVIHEYRSQKGPYRLSRWTATAVVLTSLTTMVGFGSLMMAEHRGLQSLGRVLTLGVFCCLFTSLVPLPAFLTWISRNRGVGSPPKKSQQGNAPSPEAQVEVAATGEKIWGTPHTNGNESPDRYAERVRPGRRSAT
jgi:uncharacterized protein